METWIHAAALLFLVLYAAIQVPAVLWISRLFELEDGERVDPTGGVFEEGDRSHIPEENYEAVHVPGEDGEPPVSDRTKCAICGTENEPNFRFCQNCVAPL